MSFKEDFDAWKKHIEVMPLCDVKRPDMPIDRAAADAETLRGHAEQDKMALMAAGLDWTIVEDLLTLPGALRYAQAKWMSEFKTKNQAQKEWHSKSPEAYALRDELLHHLSFAYRKIPGLKKKIMRIRENRGHVNMLQDLMELAVLAENNPEPLKAIHYNTELPPKARRLSHEMTEVLANAHESREERSALKIRRDKVYTLLMERVRSIREVGRYVFWRTPERKVKYINTYK
jgi:hypothetical protein